MIDQFILDHQLNAMRIAGRKVGAEPCPVGERDTIVFGEIASVERRVVRRRRLASGSRGRPRRATASARQRGQGTGALDHGHRRADAAGAAPAQGPRLGQQQVGGGVPLGEDRLVVELSLIHISEPTRPY